MKPLTWLTLFALATLSLSGQQTKKTPELPATGVNLARPSGGWLNATVEGNRLVVHFFNEKKEPVAANIERATARFLYTAKKDTRGVLNRSEDQQELSTPANVRPPHNFRVFLSLFASDSEEPYENHQFKYP